MRTCSVYKNDCQPDIQLSISCLHEFLLPFVLSFCLSFSLSPFLAWCAFLPLVPHSSSSTPLLSSFHQISPAQSFTAIRVVSFNQASSSAYFYPLYILCFPIFPSSSQSPVSSKCSGRLRSCNVSSLFELETAFSLFHVSSHHSITFIFIPYSSHPLCALFCLLLSLFNVVPSCLPPCCLSSSFSPTLENLSFFLFSLEINDSDHGYGVINTLCGSIYPSRTAKVCLWFTFWFKFISLQW